MKLILAILTMVISSPLFAQINLDSLKTALEKDHLKEKSSNNWNAYTLKYLDANCRVKHIIPFNRSGEIEENIRGIALTSYEYDKRGRQIEQRYYDRKGKLHFGDWPPIIRTEYGNHGKISVVRYYGKDHKPAKGYAKRELKYDKEGNLIEERRYNEKFELEGEQCITRYKYSKDGKTVTESRYNAKEEIYNGRYGAYTIKTYATSKRKKLIDSRTEQHE